MDTDECGDWQQPDLGRPAAPRTGRGAVSNPAGRFEPTRAEVQDDGWGNLDEPLPPLATTVLAERARSIISRNDSPDVPFEQSINAYRGCEHGCVYCFARPTHSYVGLSPGLDFETKLFYKVDAAALLRRELTRPGYRCTPIALGTNTDPYQPLERKLRVTRSLLEVFDECSHPFSIVTKSALVTRDLDLLAPLAARRLVRVYVSITTLCDDLKRRMEPRAASPGARLAAVRALSRAGVPVGVMVAPVVPGLTDHELEAILERAAEAGAQSAAFLLMRLPHEVKDLFYEWAGAHYPQKVSRIRSILRDLRGGRDNDPRFGKRMTGEGPFADLLRQRYHAACRRLGLDDQRATPLDTTAFRPPRGDSPQLPLF